MTFLSILSPNSNMQRAVQETTQFELYHL